MSSILQMGLELEVAAYLLFLCNKAANHRNNLRIEKSNRLEQSFSKRRATNGIALYHRLWQYHGRQKWHSSSISLVFSIFLSLACCQWYPWFRWGISGYGGRAGTTAASSTCPTTGNQLPFQMGIDIGKLRGEWNWTKCRDYPPSTTQQPAQQRKVSTRFMKTMH